GCEGLPKGQIFFLGHGAVEIIGAALAVAGSPKAQIVADALPQDDGGRGIVEIEVFRLGQLLQGAAHGTAGKGTCGDDHDPRGNSLAFFPDNFDQRMLLEAPGDLLGKELSVYG